MEKQLEPEHTPERKIHLYHCDHRGLPLALIDEAGAIAWQAEYDEWGNQLAEENPHHLQQLIRLPGQQADEETGLYYNRHRYYDPQQGRYITQDPIGLAGGWNQYSYPLDPLQRKDPLGLSEFGKWTGSAFNLPAEDIGAALDAANGPHYQPLSGSISVDIGASVDVFTGGSLSAGIAIGTNSAASGNKDICAYYMTCKHGDNGGIGAAAGLALSGTLSSGGLATGQTDSSGVIYSGGLLGKLSASGAKDNSGNFSGTLSFGPGAGVYGGAITCSQPTICISELLG